MDLSGTKEAKKGNCRKCGKNGHYIRECRVKKKTEEQRLN